MSQSKYERLKNKTELIVSLWEKSDGIAPDDVTDKLKKAMLKWQVELTTTLEIWINKGITMTDGELILAYANLGSVVESWLKFFYCVYYEDYCKDPIKSKKDKPIEPEKATFNSLKEFSTGNLWDDINSREYKWVDSVQHKRNAIHSFQFKDIGTPQEFLNDVDYLLDFVDILDSRLPPIDDCFEVCCYE